VGAARLEVRTTMAASTAARACPGGEPAREACARALYRVSAAGVPLAPRAVAVARTAENDLEATVEYPAPAAGPLRIEAAFFARLPDPTYGAVLTVLADGRLLGQQLLRADEPALEVPLAAAAAAAAPALPSFGRYLRLGVEHILGGTDHLLFLAGLLVACRRLRAVLGVVTCFSLAHSLSLALAVLGLVSVPGRVVEPLIAASIVFVGVQNLRRTDGRPRERYAVAFLFGLVHGLGFASALRAASFGAAAAPIAVQLLAFNLGVELGQLAVAAPFLLAFRAALRWPPFARSGPRLISAVVVAFGVYWLVTRAASAAA
jgi:hydrogenase/urease accessory protein HupE